MELLSLSNNKWQEVQVNLFVVLLFVFVNPIYALFVCAFLNLINSRINYRLFSIMFALSFTLFFTLRDWTVSYEIAGDAINFINIFNVNSVIYIYKKQ